MLAGEAEYMEMEEAVLDAMQGEDAPELVGDLHAVVGDETPEDRARLAAEIEQDSAVDALPPEPHVTAAGIWRELQANGATTDIPLNAQQLDAYEKVKAAGDKQLLVFLSGQGGTGKSTLIRLLTAYWRSQGLRVLLTASSGKAARLIGGHTVHTAFKLHPSGLFLRQGLEGEQGTRHFNYLATIDIVIIDEISMLSADCFTGINTALNYVVSRATTQRGLMAYGRKSILAVGDLYQLPAIERAQFEDQIYDSELWPEFRFLELTQIMRLDPEEVEFAGLLSRARKGWQRLTDADWVLLESRVCANHCAQCERFEDIMMVRPPGGRRRDEREVRQMVFHCPCTTLRTLADGSPDYARAACVLASRRAKIDELNRMHARSQPYVASTHMQAIDSTSSGGAVTQAELRSTISDRLPGLPQELSLHVGMLVLLTVNRRSTHPGFVNGSLAVVEALEPAHAPTQVVARLLDEPDGAPSVRVRRVEAETEVSNVSYTRLMFPIIPAFAMTIHRVQGATLTGEVHVLLNREIFAAGSVASSYPAKRPPAMSRTTRACPLSHSLASCEAKRASLLRSPTRSLAGRRTSL